MENAQCLVAHEVVKGKQASELLPLLPAKRALSVVGEAAAAARVASSVAAVEDPWGGHEPAGQERVRVRDVVRVGIRDRDKVNFGGLILLMMREERREKREERREEDVRAAYGASERVAWAHDWRVHHLHRSTSGRFDRR